MPNEINPTANESFDNNKTPLEDSCINEEDLLQKNLAIQVQQHAEDVQIVGQSTESQNTFIQNVIYETHCRCNEEDKVIIMLSLATMY